MDGEGERERVVFKKEREREGDEMKWRYCGEN